MTDLPFTECIDCDTADEFIDYLRPSNARWGDRTECMWVFRGQRDSEWPLIPSAWRSECQGDLERLVLRMERVQQGVAREFKITSELERQYVLHRAVEHEAVLHFAGLANQIGYPVPEAEGIVAPESVLKSLSDLAEEHGFTSPGTPFCIAQHHGIPTRLLDWTSNPMIAAFFAAEHGAQRIAVWAFDRSRSAAGQQLLLLTCPRHEGSFIHAQEGLFLWQHAPGHLYRRLGRWPTFHESLELGEKLPPGYRAFRRITLDASEVDALQVRLYREGLHHARLMPIYSNVTETLRNRWRLDHLALTQGPLIENHRDSGDGLS